ncbi:MAG: tetratricopeptide repeat protein [Bacteroidia bacterium]|nr:tetratricopeptide repeat protein [Bacteroidia bacterium]
MDEEKNKEALKIFKLNTQLYPDQWNTFDSYGECLLKLGDIELGIEAYKKSLELNPNNTTAKEVLAKYQNKG